MKVRGYNFVDAVIHLAGDDMLPVSIPPKAKPPPKSIGNPGTDQKPLLALPPRSSDNSHVIAYLEKRGISKPAILSLIEKNLLYESHLWHNCVFIGRDERGKARYAAIRGTAGEYKCDAKGSNKQFGFVLPPADPRSDAVAVFESPIDILSHQELHPVFGGHRLSLGGSSLSALTYFLSIHPSVKSITVCTDNDAAGNRAAKEIMKLPGYDIRRNYPPNGAKDWNDALLASRKERNLEDKRKTIRFIDSSYNTLFTVKDGERIRLTIAYDGEVKDLKCRWIDDTHVRLIGKYSNDYHICEFAEKMEKCGNKYELIPGQAPVIDILAAKSGGKMEEMELPMTKEALDGFIGGEQFRQKFHVAETGYALGVMLKGKDGFVVCGFDSDTMTSLHPYNVKILKQKLGVIEPPGKPSVLGDLKKLKAEADALNGEKQRTAKGKENPDRA